LFPSSHARRKRARRPFPRIWSGAGLLAALAGLLAALVPLLAGPAARADTQTATEPSPAYWLLTDNGGMMSFGGTRLYGAATSLGARAVGLAGTPTGRGYWVAGANGAVQAFGDAGFFGSAANLHLAAPVVGIASTADGLGYWLVASDGGIFCFGDAQFFGSTGDIRLNQPIVGMAAQPKGLGYWLVARDGGVFAFGGAPFLGSTGAMRLNQPIVGMSPTPDGLGYWLVARDGGIFSFGLASFYGSTGAIRLNSPIVGMAAVPDGSGYWLTASDGGIFSFGSADFRGSAGSTPLLHQVVAIGEGLGYGTGVVTSANEGIGPYPAGATGFDISWPQCGNGYPGGHQIGVVGINYGHAFSTNPCLESEVAWAGPGHELYMNVNSPNGTTYANGATGPAGSCSSSDASCWSYNYGWNAAGSSMAVADQDGVQAQQWWLDVETGNYWSQDQGANARVIQGAIDALHSSGLSVGIYSTSYQFGVITGGANFGVPVWVATGSSPSDLSSWCSDSHAFGGGGVWLVQYGSGGFDGDYAC